MSSQEAEQPVKIDRGEVLLREYEQAGEAFRNQGSLLNRAYYLSAVVGTFLIGSIFNLLAKNEFAMAALLSFLGFPAFLILGAGARSYHRRRKAATLHRGEVANKINSYFDGNPLELGPRVTHGGEHTEKAFSERRLKKLYRVLYVSAFLSLILGFAIVIWRYSL